ncbi:DUF2291 family protein [Halotalea alkalilenta]|uniref:DUF2291 domain-containing protein n=1 Tax=Halotalea alkalilenta TaxID=376489 RepID=A0A172YDX5_9GAMM|nr:DUF2291 family protein [Halotalea alkalilenta]ANF57459.1 hypothetical protein A5892_08265 [Halotalea alkalilenta]
MATYRWRLPFPILPITLVALSLALLELTRGPLVTLRPVDPDSGRVIRDTEANSAGLDQKFAVGSFDPATYVDNQWSTQVLPTLERAKLDAATLFAALAEDPDGARQRYGQPSGTPRYAIEGSARVVEVRTDTPMGVVVLELDGVDTPAQLFAGPLVVDTSLRDAMEGMGLDSFTNQMQFADVAQALNQRALAQAYADHPASTLEGQRVRFLGVFDLRPSGPQRIVPVSLKVAP